ncbi:unnamed protein product, partial [Polarella glacialis]
CHAASATSLWPALGCHACGLPTGSSWDAPAAAATAHSFGPDAHSSRSCETSDDGPNSIAFACAVRCTNTGLRHRISAKSGSAKDCDSNRPYFRSLADTLRGGEERRRNVCDFRRRLRVACCPSDAYAHDARKCMARLSAPIPQATHAKCRPQGCKRRCWRHHERCPAEIRHRGPERVIFRYLSLGLGSCRVWDEDTGTTSSWAGFGQ